MASVRLAGRPSVIKSATIVTDGLIFDIKRFAVHDGPGIRTTVFFKGCPLSCWWCHNPESRSDEAQKTVKHLSLDGKLFEREEITGVRKNVDEIVAEVEQDRIFYEESGGGITLSGGEPVFQPDFCESLLKTMKDKGLHTALDTSGYVPAEVMNRMIPYTDLFLYDLKLMDDTEHFQYTGVSNKIIMDNLRLLMEAGSAVIIRFPVIPGITDNRENVCRLITFLRDVSRGTVNNSQPHHLTTSLPEVHLLPYHAIARNKYRRFQMEDKMGTFAALPGERLAEVKELFRREGFIIS